MTSNEAVQASETTASIPETIPETMKAAVLRDHEVGLQIETLRTPRPKSGEVLIKVAACGLCHSDLHVIGGAIAFPLPAVLGHEVSGTIVELGPGNEHTGLTIGQKVAGGFLMPCGQCDACASGRDELCGPFFDLNRLKGVLYDGTTRLATPDGEPVAMYSMGGLAEYAVVPSTAVAPVPDTIDMVPAAILGCAAMTGYGAVRRGADLRYGETVAVVATGGVGTNIVQIARAFGASQVIAIDVDDEKLAPMLDYGATAVVNSVTQDAREEVFRLTGGKGVDVFLRVIDTEACAAAGVDPHVLHQGLGTVVSASDHNALFIQNIRGIMRVHILYVKSDRRYTPLRMGVIHIHKIEPLQPGDKLLMQLFNIAMHSIES